MWGEEHESQISSRESLIETTKFGFPVRRVFVGSRVLYDIENLFKVVFSSYRNHYSSNPKLQGTKPVEAYEDWALSKLDQEGSTFLLRENAKNIGYALVETQLNSVNVLLAGVVPEAEGTGAYRNFLRL
jgi:hypothetical protein